MFQDLDARYVQRQPIVCAMQGFTCSRDGWLMRTAELRHVGTPTFVKLLLSRLIKDVMSRMFVMQTKINYRFRSVVSGDER